MSNGTQRAGIAALGACIALLTGAVLPSRLVGQQVEVTPFVGLYLPTSSVIQETAVGLTVSGKHGTTFLFGARLTYWTSPSVGLEASLGYTPSSMTFSVDTGGVRVGSADTSAHVILGSARVLYKVGPKGGDTDIHLLAGVGFISHGGAAYDLLGQGGGGISGTTDIGGVVGASVRFRVSAKLKARVDVEDNLYSAKFNIGGAETTSHFQNDIAVSLGLAIPL
ncbi:MAG TPA: hypothetical protein VMH88_12470 [Gemmatimonadales bacterium]|nr:hypothetical protein [Gemmatimonadales bacterium]